MTSTTPPGPATVAPIDDDTPSRRGLYNVRYGEVLLLRVNDGNFVAEVWNTLGMNDCPQAEWDKLDAAAIAAERGAMLAVLNGPRYWTLDFIQSNIRENAPETTFGGLGMFQAAVIDFGTQPPAMGAYIERSIVRQTIFGFEAGRQLYELVNPDGQTYVMQAYSLAVDKTQTIDSLAQLGSRLALPDGWTFTVRTLDEELGLRSTNGVATVLQDNLQNTYQRVD